jgi:hypothetical protein
VGRRKSQQPGDALLVPVILGGALLEHAAELFPEEGVLVRVMLGQIVEGSKDALDGVRADHFHIPRLLQDFARDVERQIARVDHAAHKP